MKIGFEPTDEQRRYIEASARLRGIAPQTLLRRVLKIILDDQMIINILDDEPELKRPMTIVQQARAGTLRL